MVGKKQIIILMFTKQDTVLKKKNAGLKIGSWTVNELSDLAILQAQGVEWITTNQPLQFQKQLKDLKQ
jgi:glycerophosphoryl diester phosphodiesterase